MHIFCHRFCARLLSQPMTKQMQNYDKTRATLQIALLFVRTLDNTLCMIWREQQEKRSRRRLLVYPILLVLLPLFVGLINLLRNVLAVQLPGLANTLSTLLSLLSATLLLWLPYRFVPKRRAPEYCPLLTAFGVALLMKAARYI